MQAKPMFPSTKGSSTPHRYTSSELEAERLERAKQAARIREGQKRERCIRKAALIPERYRNAAITVKPVEDWVSAVLSWDSKQTDGAPNLYLAGSNGTGKTTQAYAAVRKLLESGVNCIFGTSGDFLRAVKDSYGYRSTESEEDVMARYAGVPVLMLDDLGKESPSQWAVEHLFDVIDRRTAGMRPIVVTTNLAVSELAGRYGEPGTAITSRLMGGAVLVRMKGGDMRAAG